ncbi:MAG: helix-turn-helix domain-containing protein [Magnetospirillum sp.]
MNHISWRGVRCALKLPLMVIALKQAVGQNVRTARLACGLTQEDLAERVNRTTETVSNIERGKNPPSLETLHDIAAALGCSLDVLVLGAGRPISPARLRNEARLTHMLHTFSDSDLETALQMLEVFAQRKR